MLSHRGSICLTWLETDSFPKCCISLCSHEQLVSIPVVPCRCQHLVPLVFLSLAFLVPMLSGFSWWLPFSFSWWLISLITPSYAYWQFTYFLLWNACYGLFPILKFCVLFLNYSFVGMFTTFMFNLITNNVLSSYLSIYFCCLLWDWSSILYFYVSSSLATFAYSLCITFRNYLSSEHNV